MITVSVFCQRSIGMDTTSSTPPICLLVGCVLVCAWFARRRRRYKCTHSTNCSSRVVHCAPQLAHCGHLRSSSVFRFPWSAIWTPMVHILFFVKKNIEDSLHFFTYQYLCFVVMLELFIIWLKMLWCTSYQMYNRDPI